MVSVRWWWEIRIAYQETRETRETEQHPKSVTDKNGRLGDGSVLKNTTLQPWEFEYRAWYPSQA